MQLITLFLAAHFAPNARGDGFCKDKEEQARACKGWYDQMACADQSVRAVCKETCFFEDNKSKIIIGGVEPPTIVSHANSNCVLKTEKTKDIEKASWIAQDPTCPNHFYAAIENWWAPKQNNLEPPPGVQKWRLSVKNNAINVEDSWVVSKTRTDWTNEDKDSKDLIQRNCAPVHVIIVDEFLAVSWFCGANKAAGEVTILEKGTLNKKCSLKGKGGFHGAFEHEGYLYLAMFHKKKVCWVAVSQLRDSMDVDLADEKNKNKCVDLDAKPRHIAFKNKKAYVVCEPPEENNIAHNNLYVYDISDGTLGNAARYCLSSQIKTDGTRCLTTDDNDHGADYLSEVLVIKNFLYISNRHFSEEYTHENKDNSEVKKRNGIFVLNLAKIDEDAKSPLRLNTEKDSVPLRVKTMAVDKSNHILGATGQFDGRTVTWKLKYDGDIDSYVKPKVVHSFAVGRWNGPTFVGFINNADDKILHSCGGASSFRSADSEGEYSTTSLSVVIPCCIVAAIAIAGGIYALDQRKKQRKKQKRLKSEPYE